ncbi:major Facilitator Superfamily protein [Variibacter gotjawalensis]|uniref:Major Facilitator Superfamily protein n=1 Tax=Variibacter gotjawalensis TaxID=1333996 RepID=A0A0S3PY97_9BRAD|nr:MFS transporter [Variibacter gotjawalensis]NIK46702.1 MFS family permease [Variibacter gotjawalensis]RZS48605.1 putative MFS family arabinose efflux permease [Variibacter gotjawalensis]BAT60867.1 major Facilitator Superfamily protein [Variibacter gotjawalensis]
MNEVSNSTNDETARGYHGWKIVVVCFLMALFGWGFGFYGHAVYLAEIQRLRGWPASIIASATTLYYLCGAILVVFTADLVRRLGPKAMVLGGIACMATAAFLITIVDAIWELYAAYLLMAIGWASLGLGSITNILGLWFRTKRGMAISLALNGASCGGIILAPILVLLSARVGFVYAMWIAIAAMLLILVPLVLFWLRAPEIEPPKPGVAPEVVMTKAEALRSFAFWSVAGPFALALVAQVGFIVHQVAYLTPALGRDGVAVSVAITTTMAVIGRVGLGTIIDKLDQRRASAISFTTQGLALAAMTLTNEPLVLYLCCAVFGFSVGNLITFPALIVQREFPAAAFGTVIALVTATTQFIYAFGPGLLGLVRDASGSYAAAVYVCVAFFFAAAVLVLMRPRTV